MREDKKLLDEKLQKIMDKKMNEMAKATKKQKKDEVDDDPLFGNKNPFSGAKDAPTENAPPVFDSMNEAIKQLY